MGDRLETVRRWARSPWVRRAGLAALAILLLFLWWSAVRRAVAGPSSQLDDFVRFARHLVFEGRNVYDEYDPTYTITKYPPFLALLFAPLVWLPMPLAASLWFWANLALSVGAAWLAARALAAVPDAPLRQPSLAWTPYVLTAPVVISNLTTSQVNIVILFLVALALYAFRRGRDGTAGAILGMSVALKLTPALFLLWFAWKREWRVVLGGAGGIVLCWGAALLLGLGPERYVDIMGSWLHEVSPWVTEGTSAEKGGFRHTNQALSAAIHRHLTETNAEGGLDVRYVNVIDLGPDAAERIVVVLSAGIVALVGWISRGRLEDRSGPELGLEAGLVALATLLISPISWINHYVLVLIPYSAAWNGVATWPEDTPGRRAQAIGTGVGVALLLTSVSRLLQAWSLPFLGALALGAGLARARLFIDARPSSGSSKLRTSEQK